MYLEPSESLEAMVDEPENFTAVMPILASPITVSYGEEPYIPLMTAEQVMYVTIDRHEEEHHQQSLEALLNTWPLFAFALLLSFQAGIIIWLTDTWTNQEEFPRPFPRGPLEGTWWAFVSMTTVGYGDKTPRSVLGRMVAVLWIVLGIAISGIFTASLTSVMTQEFIEEPIDLTGEKIGTLNTTRYEYGAIVQEKGQPQLFGDIFHLKEAIKNGEIAGFVMDNNVLNYHWQFLKFDLNLRARRGIKIPEQTYGMFFKTKSFSKPPMIRNESALWGLYLRGFFEENKDNENILVSLAQQNMSIKLDHKIVKSSAVVEDSALHAPGTVNGILTFLGITTAILLFIGITFDLLRRYYDHRFTRKVTVVKECQDVKTVTELHNELARIVNQLKDLDSKPTVVKKEAKEVDVASNSSCW